MNVHSYMSESTKNKKAHIVQTAMILFSEQGYNHTSVKMIAQSAGVSQGLMYNFFSGKEDLLKYIFQLSLEDIADSLQPPGIVPGTLEALKQYLQFTFQMIDEKREFWRLIHAVRMQESIQELLKEEFAQMQTYIIGQLTAYLQPLNLPETETEVRLLFATIDGIAGHLLLDPQYPIQSVINHLMKRYE
ncbi:MAG: TetR/AcrR family transcriptional regulator [Bacteroidetes bacterium]|nr:TetR/AcrR family transcriptional regulator [Bacteroidota bacterium]